MNETRFQRYARLARGASSKPAQRIEPSIEDLKACVDGLQRDCAQLVRERDTARAELDVLRATIVQALVLAAPVLAAPAPSPSPEAPAPEAQAEAHVNVTSKQKR